MSAKIDELLCGFVGESLAFPHSIPLLAIARTTDARASRYRANHGDQAIPRRCKLDSLWSALFARFAR